jgi:hypothetical protein
MSVLTFSFWTGTPLEAMMNGWEIVFWGMGKLERKRRRALFQLKSSGLVNLLRVDADVFREL